MKSLILTLFLVATSGAYAAAPSNDNALNNVPSTKHPVVVKQVAFNVNNNTLGRHWNPGGFGPGV